VFCNVFIAIIIIIIIIIVIITIAVIVVCDVCNLYLRRTSTIYDGGVGVIFKTRLRSAKNKNQTRHSLPAAAAAGQNTFIEAIKIKETSSSSDTTG